MSDADRRRQLARRARIAARLRRRRAHPMLRGGSASAGIRLNMAAMIDIVFLLLIYFMLIAEFRPDESSFATSSGIAGAAATDPFALPDRPITVRVMTLGDPEDETSGLHLSTDSSVFSDVSSMDAFEAAAREALDVLLAPEQEFVIVPAPGTRWAHALAVVNTLHLAGYSTIRLEEPEMPGGDGEVLE